MSAIDELVGNASSYRESFDNGDLPLPPAKKVAIVACMDARLNPYGGLGTPGFCKVGPGRSTHSWTAPKVQSVGGFSRRSFVTPTGVPAASTATTWRAGGPAADPCGAGSRWRVVCCGDRGD